MNISSALLLGSLFRVMLLDLMVTWVNVLCGQSSHICRFSTFIALLQWLADLLSVTFLFIWKPCCLSFPNSKDICCLPHQHDNLFTVCQSLVGLDTILYTLSIFFVFLQIQRALTPFHQENVIVQLFLHTGGLCQNTMHDGSKTSKRSDALQQGPLERYVVRPPY